jgi:AcrR family transcriptional regulator
MASKAPPIDKRRQILDAAIRVFARQGFHSTRVSDIADEAGVAYGLVYHYFKSKDEVLNELFSERWSLLLSAIEESDREGASPRAKLEAVAGFIVDSYRHDPELMKVIIVEVTRAANSFGRTHLAEIRRAYDSIAKIVADGQEAGVFRRDIDPTFASMSFYGAIEQLLSGWIFEVIPASDTDFDQAKSLLVATICDGIEPLSVRSEAMDNEIVKRLAWSGVLAASSALASIAATRLAAVIWKRVFDEEPPE